MSWPTNPATLTRHLRIPASTMARRAAAAGSPRKSRDKSSLMIKMSLIPVTLACVQNLVLGVTFRTTELLPNFVHQTISFVTSHLKLLPLPAALTILFGASILILCLPFYVACLVLNRTEAPADSPPRPAKAAPRSVRRDGCVAQKPATTGRPLALVKGLATVRLIQMVR